MREDRILFRGTHIVAEQCVPSSNVFFSSKIIWCLKRKMRHYQAVTNRREHNHWISTQFWMFNRNSSTTSVVMFYYQYAKQSKTIIITKVSWFVRNVLRKKFIYQSLCIRRGSTIEWSEVKFYEFIQKCKIFLMTMRYKTEKERVCVCMCVTEK